MPKSIKMKTNDPEIFIAQRSSIVSVEICFFFLGLGVGGKSTYR